MSKYELSITVTISLLESDAPPIFAPAKEFKARRKDALAREIRRGIIAGLTDRLVATGGADVEQIKVSDPYWYAFDERPHATGRVDVRGIEQMKAAWVEYDAVTENDDMPAPDDVDAFGNTAAENAEKAGNA